VSDDRHYDVIVIGTGAGGGTARARQPLRRRHQLLPSISAVNPCLTAIANALRVGDHVLERLG
jgi:choline dehydrogenase-like flavoprotein